MLRKHERQLVEAVQTFLQQDPELGLKIHSKKHAESGIHERGLEHLHGHITELFALKASGSNFYESLSQAFNKVHSYKYIDDPTFTTAMNKELTAQGIPAEERSKAVGYVQKIITELRADDTAWSEQDYGFNPNLGEIRMVSRPPQYRSK